MHKLFRKEDAIKLELVHIAKLDQNGTRYIVLSQPWIVLYLSSLML